MAYRVFLNDNHTPHAFAVITCLPDVEFYMTGWNGTFRPPPKNLHYLPHMAFAPIEYDCFFEEEISNDPLRIKAKRKVYFRHCEYSPDPSFSSQRIIQAISQYDAAGFPSSHRRATFGILAPDVKCHVLEPGFSSEYFRRRPSRGTVPGTMHNGCDVNSEVASVCVALARKLPGFTLIGHGNRSMKQFMTVIEPDNFEESRRALMTLDVFVYCVSGNAFGMSPVEAMVAGIPLVTGNSRDIRPWLKSGENCFISKNPAFASIDELVDMVNDLSGHPGLHSKISEAGMEVAHKYCSAEATSPAFRNFLGA